MTETTHALTEDELVALHRGSMNNRARLAGRCGCFHCLSTFMAECVHDWADDGQTALCPVCGIDAVLAPEHEPVDPDALEQMQRRWFGRAHHPGGGGWLTPEGGPAPLLDQR